MKNISIFASGTGTNADRIIRHFDGSPHARVGSIFCDREDAKVLRIAQREGIPSFLINNGRWKDGQWLCRQLEQAGADFIVLAGYLRLVPGQVIDTYRGRIVNIHPALLPSYGGRGMYGDNVHRAVIAAGEPRSGITIHAVNEQYDSGDIIFQDAVPVLPADDAWSLAAKIHELEYRHYPVEIEKLIKQL